MTSKHSRLDRTATSANNGPLQPSVVHNSKKHTKARVRQHQIQVATDAFRKHGLSGAEAKRRARVLVDRWEAAGGQQ